MVGAGGTLPALTRPTRPELLATRLADLRGLWLLARCACGSEGRWPCLLLARQRGARLMVAADVLPRLRCRHCERRPEEVAAVDDPATGASGRGVDGEWRVVLFP